MRILIVAATEFEIRPLLSHLVLVRKETDSLFHYKFRSTPLDILIPGVGMMQTAFHLGKQLTRSRYTLAINAGIAGTYNPGITIGSVVNVTEDCLPDMGAEDGEKFLSIFELGLMDPDEFPYRSGKLCNFREPSLHSIRHLPKVKGNTFNLIKGNTETIKKTKNLFPADIESMEGAAFLFSCLNERIPCLQLRSISNNVEERDKSKWDLPLALKNLNNVLFDVIQEECGIKLHES